MRKLLIFILSFAILAVTAAVAMGGDDPDQQMVDEVLQTVLPNAGGELSGDSGYDGARRLTVRLAEPVDHWGPTPRRRRSRARLTWRGCLNSPAARRSHAPPA